MKTLFFILSIFYSFPLSAQWIPNTAVNNVVDSLMQDQLEVQIVTDGASGAIVSWTDNRDGTPKIYAQRFDSLGFEQWPLNGVKLSDQPGTDPQAVSDGMGGVIVTWGGTDIYAQRVNASGNILWGSNGVAVCTATGDQLLPQLDIDFFKSVVITWQDMRNGNGDIFAQKVDSSGNIQWNGNGIAIASGNGDQMSPQIVRDAVTGAYIAWVDNRNGGNNADIVIKRIDMNGIDVWSAVDMVSAQKHQYRHQLMKDGSGGAIAVWEDERGNDIDIYAQRINNGGYLQWTNNGVAVVNAPGDQQHLSITNAGFNVVVVWQDNRPGSNGDDIYAQNINALGNPLWPANGVAICTATGNQEHPSVYKLTNYGIYYISWQDYRGADADIYSQKIDYYGTVQWMTDGLATSTATGDQLHSHIINGMQGGAIVTWTDERNVSNSGSDVYITYIVPTIVLPVDELEFTGMVTNNSIALSWNGHPDDKMYLLEKKGNSDFDKLAVIEADGLLMTYQFTDKEPFNGLNYYRLTSTDEAGNIDISEVLLINYFKNSSFTFYPNPANQYISIEAEKTCTIFLYDMAGKMVKEVLYNDPGNQMQVDISDVPEGAYNIQVAGFESDILIILH